MTYGPPPSQGWQPPPQQPPPGYGPPGFGPPRPGLPGYQVTLGILGIVFALSAGSVVGPAFVSAFAIKMVVALLALVGGIMVLSRARAGTIMLAVASGLNTLVFVLSFFVSSVAPEPTIYFVVFGIDTVLLLANTVLGIAVLVLALLPAATQAQSPAGPPPPGHRPPPGYGPPPGQRPPQGWR